MERRSIKLDTVAEAGVTLKDMQASRDFWRRKYREVRAKRGALLEVVRDVVFTFNHGRERLPEGTPGRLAIDRLSGAVDA